MSKTISKAYRPAPVRVAKRSPNRQRAIARVTVWMVALSGAVLWLPHVLA
jgi:hypothetical protein